VDKRILEQELEDMREEVTKVKHKTSDDMDYDGFKLHSMHQTTIDAKDQLISDLEYKIFELESNANLNSLNSDWQKKAIDELNEKLQFLEPYKDLYDQLSEDNTFVKNKIEQLENRNETLNKNISIMKKETLAMSKTYGGLGQSKATVGFSPDKNGQPSNKDAFDTSFENLINSISQDYYNKHPETKDGGPPLGDKGKQSELVREISGISMIASKIKQCEAMEKSLESKVNNERHGYKLLREFEKSLDNDINVLGHKVQTCYCLGSLQEKIS
jgi:hypothetical protein